MSELTDTDMPHAAAQGHHAPARDHMGRPIAENRMEALKHDLPWMVGLVLLLVFLVGALAGFWGR